MINYYIECGSENEIEERDGSENEDGIEEREGNYYIRSENGIEERDRSHDKLLY